MKFVVTRASDRDYEAEVEFATLEEFLAWCEAQKDKVIIDAYWTTLAGGAPHLEIYDSYRE